MGWNPTPSLPLRAHGTPGRHSQVERGPSFGNARYVRNVLEAAIGRHAWRLREVDAPTLEQLRLLLAEDLAPPAEVVEPFGAAEPVDVQTETAAEEQS